MPQKKAVTHHTEPLEITHLAQLVGKTVKNVIEDPSQQRDIGTIYGLEFTDGTLAWVLADPEGNGPGFLEIEGKK